jgi:hypothetical protein
MHDRFSFDIDQTLPPCEAREDCQLRDQAAEFIVHHGLASFAIFLLESHRPMRNLAFQAGIVAEPFLAIFPKLQWKTWRDALFGSDESVTDFMQRIEQHSKKELL